MAEPKKYPELTVTQIQPQQNTTSSANNAVLVDQNLNFSEKLNDEVNEIAESSPKIVLATLNAKYFHTSFGLRYLYANLKELQQYCEIQEFIIQTRAIDIVEQILASKPDIVGFGVYIWNIVETTDVVSLLKVIAPEITVVNRLTVNRFKYN